MKKYEQYITDVLSGDQVVGKYVRLAVQRHVDDLKKQSTPDFPYHFSEKKADGVLAFFEQVLKHSIGEHAGDPFILEPWQAFCLANIFGWQRDDGRGRRFRRVYWSMARKQGKSTVAAGIALFMSSCDINPITNEPEGQAQVILAATKREQSEKVIFAECERMRRQATILASGSNNANKQISFSHNGGTISSVGSDRPYDGLNPAMVCLDETHAWRELHRKFYNTMVTGSGSRVQPLALTVTTAGDDQSHLWIEEVGFARAVLDKTVSEDSLFAAIYEIDEKDDPFDESVWCKANPNLGVSISLEFLRGQIKPAMTNPMALNRFKRYHANILVSSTQRIFDLEAFDKCAGNLSDWKKADCVTCGVDLGGRDDLAAYAMVARFDTGEVDSERAPVYRYEFKTKQYISRNTARDLTAVPFCTWIEDGTIRLTDSPMTDLQADLLDDYWKVYASEIAIDPYQAQQFGEQVEQLGAIIATMPQSTRHFNEPISALRQALEDGTVTHDGSQIMRWCLKNAVAVQDRQGRYMLDKSNSSSKIDPLVALVMAFGRAMLAKGRGDGQYLIT